MTNQLTLDVVNSSFSYIIPKEAARAIESMSPSQAAKILDKQPTDSLINIWLYLPITRALSILLKLQENTVIRLLTSLDPGVCANLIRRLEAQKKRHFLSVLEPSIAAELSEILHYPPNTIGSIMNINVVAFHKEMMVVDAIGLLKNNKVPPLHYIFIIDKEMKLCGQVDTGQLIVAPDTQTLESLSTPIRYCADVLDLTGDVIEKIQKNKSNILPVTDVNHRLVGVVHSSLLLEELKESIVTDMQTMVGASAEERALSRVSLVVRMRLPWLQINLITAFMAACVVGLFEDTIAKYTALAVLMPIASGQAGNTGAQALAVTIRGLALHEITVRDWFKIAKKELIASFINGLVTAVVCGISVYLWHKNMGLSMILGLAILISMSIAAISGSLLPIIVKRFGFDPAQSSTIFLTTITDISGFMSFLGIATLLSNLL